MARLVANLSTDSETARKLRRARVALLSEPRAGRPWSPAVDIFETEDDLVLKADVPEVDLKDIDVRVENQTLTLSGERKFENAEALKRQILHDAARAQAYFRRLSRWGVDATLKAGKERRQHE